jgi:NADH-quinone oxidoreductase subunit J
MSLGEIIFLLTILITMGGALTAVLAGSIIYAMLGLIAAMFGVAGLYVYLNSSFLAMMQVLVYVGAVSILIVFAIMILAPHSKKFNAFKAPGKLLLAVVTAGVSVYLFFKFVLTNLKVSKAPEFLITTKDIGRAFTDNLVLPFELISVLIAVAIIGAVMLAIISRSIK